MVTAAQAYWLNRKRRQARNEGARGPQIALSASSQAENTSIGTTIGNLSVVGGTGTWTFTKTVDADSAFTLTTGALKNAIVFSYETKTSYSVTIQATNGTDTITRTFTISVINVLEVTLNVLTIDDNTAVPGEAWSATITGKTSGSTITATSSDGTVLSVVSTTVSGTFAGAGTPTVTLHETHPDATPRDTGIGVTVADVAEIGAPLDVTWIDGTNPVECVMNAPDDLEDGDIPQVRYGGTGTIYDGEPVTLPVGNFDFSGASLPTQPSGAGYAQYRAVRDPGGPGEVIGAWSSASEGQFDIADDASTYASTVADAITAAGVASLTIDWTSALTSKAPNEATALKNIFDTAHGYTNTGGLTFNANGCLGDGSGYLIADGNIGTRAPHFTDSSNCRFYVVTAAGVGHLGGTESSWFHLLELATGPDRVVGRTNNFGGGLSYTTTPAPGIYIINRVSDILSELWIDGVLVATDTGDGIGVVAGLGPATVHRTNAGYGTSRILIEGQMGGLNSGGISALTGWLEDFRDALVALP